MMLLWIPGSYSQLSILAADDELKPFVGIELGEAAFNKFQSLSGEIGIRFSNDQMVRLTHMNVKLTEEHLSSGFAGAVDGDRVKGSFFGFEAFYDFPVLWKGLYLSPSLGYYRNEYQHLDLDENIRNKSVTIGAAISYRETNVLRLGGLYYMISIPMRLSLHPINETRLGEATINDSTFDNNIWLFVGFEF